MMLMRDALSVSAMVVTTREMGGFIVSVTVSLLLLVRVLPTPGADEKPYTDHHHDEA